VDQFKAYVVRQGDGTADRAFETLSRSDLHGGEVTIRVRYSSVNYKDALAVSPKGRVARVSPLIPGIDLAGDVLESSDAAFAPGAEVVAHGYDLGVAHHGGFAEVARVPGGWVVPLPDGLTLRQAMAIGTAGYTAALSIIALEDHGLESRAGPVLVLGASGGVGSTAVSILAGRGYEVHASTGKPEEHDFLRGLGAAEILTREETSGEGRPLEGERWAGCVDAVGGPSLSYALRTLRLGCSVAASGNVGGAELHTTVFPFILRGVNLLGIDSANTPIARRREVWGRLAGDLRPAGLDGLTREVPFDELGAVLDETLAGKARGRTVVRL
jgi:putative YhdH/YhfP family quinone oxidoreductase